MDRLFRRLINCNMSTEEKYTLEKHTLDKYNLDCLNPQSIVGVSVTICIVHYKPSCLKHVQYLDLADLNVISKNIRKYKIGDFDKEFYHKFVEFQLDDYQNSINEFLFETYADMNRSFIDDLQFEATTKYLKLFKTLQLYNRFLISRDTFNWLLTSLFKKRVIKDWSFDISNGYFRTYQFTELDNEEQLLITNVLTSIFLNSSTAICLLTDTAYQDIVDFMFKQIRSRDTNFLSDIFRNQEFCPILTSVYTKRKELLKALLNLGLKKKEFMFTIIPHHDWLTYSPVYSAFTPVSDYGRIRLLETFSTRDHLIFELVVVLQLYIKDVSGICIMRDSIRIIYKTITYTYISASEMRTKLNDFTPRIPSEDVNNIIDAYNKLFPEMVSESCRPRALKHLSRCKVREYLGNQNLEVEIKRLNIPSQIATFLNLEDDDFPADDFDEVLHFPFLAIPNI